MREWQKWLVVLIELALIAAAVLFVISLMHEIGLAEDEWEFDAWVMCDPGDWVNVREKPDKRSAEAGRLECGDWFRTDQREKNGFVHIIDAGTESGEGWISRRYVTWQEPERIGREMRIRSGGRVACRKWIGGKRKAWAKPGQAVTVYWMNAEWAVTDRGFIQAEYLEE